MHPALAVGKTGLDAQQTNITVIAHNLSNVNTTAYKKDRPNFEDLIYQNFKQPGAQASANTIHPTGFMLGTGVNVVSIQKMLTQSNILGTGNSLDVAINGRGYFQVLLPDGTLAYTRAGDFQLDDTGRMVMPNGNVLQPEITIPQPSISVTIGNDGTVSVLQPGQTTPATVGNITTTDFINPAGLEPIGQNLYLETTASGTATTGTPTQNGLGRLQQSALEQSNVNVVEELVNMIQAQRAYEMNAKAIETVDGMLQYISQTL